MMFSRRTVFRVYFSVILPRRNQTVTSKRGLSSDGIGDLEFYGRKKMNKITLKNLLDTGSGKALGIGNPILENASLSDNINIQVACFLHRELPIRLAARALELDSNQYFRRSYYVQEVSSWYKRSFKQLIDCPAPTDLRKEKNFAKIITDIYERHAGTLLTMAKGAHEIRMALKHDMNKFAEHDEIQYKLDEFYLSRIGIRMMIGQYLQLRDNPAPDVGPISELDGKGKEYFPIKLLIFQPLKC